MSLPQINHIDDASFELLKHLDERSQKAASEIAEKPIFKPLFGISEPIDLSDYLVESKGMTEHTTDSWGNITAISHYIQGKIFELNESNYPLLKGIAAKFLESAERFLVADSNFVEQEIFEWLVDVRRQGRIGLTLTAFLEKRLSEEVLTHTFYFKVSPIGIESQIKIGPVTLHPFSEAYLRTNFEQLPKGHHDNWEKYKSIFSEVLGTVVATVEVKAVNSMAETEAETKATLAINAIKCFLFPEAIRSEYYLFDLEFKSSPPKMTTVVIKYSAQGDMRLNKKGDGGAPIELAESLMTRLNKMGLPLFHNFLLHNQQTTFYYLIERAINQLGNAFSTRDLYARAVELVSFFELFLNYDEKAGAKPLTYLTRDILSHVVQPQRLDNAKRCAQLLYYIRNRYLHNRQRVSFELRDLYEMHITAFEFLKLMISLHPQFKDKDDFFKHFKIRN